MRQFVTVFFGLVLLAAGAAAQATGFRAYRANDQMQLDRIPTLNEDEPGCHNLLLGFSVYRVAQVGFEYCAIYSEKDCKAGTEVPVTWKKEKAPVKQFTQGDRWFLVSEDPRGRSVGSWYCKARE